jgi:hypothetical protein
MTQKFGIHCINGLPDSPSEVSSIKNLYNISLIENLPNSISQIREQLTSSVYIASDPSGAKIFIDGIEQIGFNTPSMITDMQSGHHSFRLSSPGYEDIESEMPLEPGRTYNVFLTMGKSKSTTMSDSTSTDISGIVILLAIGLIGYFLLKKR